jgi:hypothetical protein
MIIEFYCLTDDEAGNKDISLGNNLLIPFMVEAINYRAKISPGHLIEDLTINYLLIFSSENFNTMKLQLNFHRNFPMAILIATKSSFHHFN